MAKGLSIGLSYSPILLYFCGTILSYARINHSGKNSIRRTKIPQSIDWSATDSTAQEAQAARAMMLTFWDPTDKTALRIDLWTKDMMVDEMADFFIKI